MSGEADSGASFDPQHSLIFCRHSNDVLDALGLEVLRLVFEKTIVGLEEHEDVVTSIWNLVTERRASAVEVSHGRQLSPILCPPIMIVMLTHRGAQDSASSQP